MHWTFAAIVLVGIGLFLLVSEDQGERQLGSVPPAAQSVSNLRTEDRIDLHLKSANVQSELEKVEAESAIPKFHKDQHQIEDFTKPMPLDRQQSVHSVEISREQEAADRNRQVLTPAQLIELDLARQQFLRQHDARARERFIQEFLNNAREQGLEIELDENLDVKSVRRNPAGSPSASK